MKNTLETMAASTPSSKALLHSWLNIYQSKQDSALFESALRNHQRLCDYTDEAMELLQLRMHKTLNDGDARIELIARVKKALQIAETRSAA